MVRLAPVFDTNVYRSDVNVAALRSLEASCDVAPLANFYTMIELGAHLGDDRDKAFKSAKAALRRLHDHTIRSDEKRHYIPFIADVEGELARQLFERSLPGRELTADLLGETLGVVATKHSADWDSRTRAVIEQLRRRRDAVERQFTEDMRRAVQALDPNAQGWRPFANDPATREAWKARLARLEDLPFAAEALVRRTASQLDLTPSNSEVDRLAGRILERYPGALHFYNQLIRKSVESGIDFAAPKHVNSIWDFHLMFLAAKGADSGDSQILLVTNDAAFAAAAELANVPDAVCTYSEYEGRLNTLAG